MRHEFTRELTGGLNTKRAPWNLPDSQSPDLDNVFLDDNGVSSRGGFVPLIRERLPMNSVRNVGFHARARLINTAGSGDGDFLNVPGHLLAGHRQPYYGASAFTFDLFFEVDDLTMVVGGNGQSTVYGGGGPPWGPAPYTVWVRPILSKGPIKRSDSTTLTFSGLPEWQTTASLQWGAGANDGMPFCLYLMRNPAPARFDLKLSAHVDVAASWTLQTATSTVPMEVGGRYHVIGVVSGARVVLRVARIYGTETPVYTENSVAFTGTLATNQCPIQVFDCPQRFIEDTAVGTGDQRPGLGFSLAANGGYWFAAARAEGRIEDLAIWLGDQLSGTNRDRVSKLDLAQQTNLLGYWDMLSSGERVVKEQTGIGNHLYLVPWGPIFDPHSGAVGGDSWWFNGLTSYALPDLDRADGSNLGNPSWRYLITGTEGAFLYAVRQNKGHGLQVQFWPDSIEPQYEQTIVELHSVLRLTIGRDGTIKGYCRTTGTGVSTYQGPVTSTITIVPGRRYQVTLWRRTGGTSLDLYINGVLDATAVVVANSNGAGTGRPVSGITVGMGCIQTTNHNTTADDLTDLPKVNEINVDNRAGFVGRIESFQVIGGYVEEKYIDEGLADWIMNQSRLWRNSSTVSAITLFTADPHGGPPDDTVASNQPDGIDGVFVELIGHTISELPIRYLVSDSTTNPQSYTLSAAPLVRKDQPLGHGHYALLGMGARIYHTLLHYRFDQDDRDEQFAGDYRINVEWRNTGGAGTGEANAFRAVHIQESIVTDDCGIGGPIQKRCIESDQLTEEYTGVGSMQSLEGTHRQRPYRFRSPKEIGTLWASGIVKPRAGQNPVTVLTDWEQQEGGRRITIAGAGRNLWQARSIWEQESPFRETDPWAVSFGGQDGDHLVVYPTTTAAQLIGTAPLNPIIVDFWCKPTAIDGDRTLIAYGSMSGAARMNYRIAINNGALSVLGTQATSTKLWAFMEGGGSGTSAVRPTGSIRCSTWNHVQVRLETGAVTAYVNGCLVPMLDLTNLTGTAQTDPWEGDAVDAPPVNAIYLGGQPRGRGTGTTAITVGGARTFTHAVKNFCGLLADVRIRTAASNVMPVSRAVAGGVLVLPLNDGTGWRMASLTGWNAQSLIRELVEVQSGLEESTDFRYATLAFRDRLLLTNGESRAQQIRYTSPTDPLGQFRCYQLGIHAPVAAGTTVEITDSSAPLGGGIVDGTVLQVWETFVTSDGKESEPTTLGTVTVTGAHTYVVIRVNNLPRSWDPQVTVRKLYCGSTDPLLVRTLPSNEGADIDFTFSENFAGETVTSGERLPAPRARHIAVAGSYVVVADLPEVAAGQNAMAWSQAQEPDYWPVDTIAVLDVEDGKPITGINRALGHVFVHKRDQISQFQPAILGDPTTVLAELRLSNASDGIGGGDIAAKNLLYGSNDRGVFVFNNVDVVYLSDAIEPTWRNYDRSDAALALKMHGLYHKVASEYWLSAPLRGEFYATTILVMLLDGPPAWSRLTVPEHSILSGIEDPQSQSRIPVIGTTSGRLLVLGTTAIDGHDGVAMLEGALALQSGGSITISAASATSITITGGSFDLLLGQHEGVEVLIGYNSGSTITRKIDSNTGTVLRWSEPIPGWATTESFTIGGYTCYWTCPWQENDDKLAGREQDLERYVLEFAPTATVVNAEIASIRQGESATVAFPAVYETLTVTPTTGWLLNQVKPQRHSVGHYHRLRLRTTGILKSWRLVGYGMEARSQKATTHGGRIA